MPTIDTDVRYQEDWRTVRFLAYEIGPTQVLGKAIDQWDKAVRYFRRVEQNRFYENEPTAIDRENHRALLHLLIGLGRNWLLESQVFSDQHLVASGFTRADLEAYIADLEDTFFMFYVPDFEPARTAELQRQIFGANP